MKKIIYALAAVLIIGSLAYHYAALEIFNAIVPKDAESKWLKSDVSFGATPRQKLDLYAPSSGQGPWPVIVFIHGGSWNSGNKEPYAFVGRALAAQGFLVAIPNYRLLPENAYPDFVEDAALAVDWATRHSAEYGGDQTQVFGMGHSAGGYNIAMAILNKSYLQKIGTDVSAIRGIATLSAPLAFLPLDTEVSISTFGKAPDLSSTQPVNFARGEAPPFLILHGDNDRTVRLINAQSLYEKMKAKNGDATLKIYPGIGHADTIIAFARPLRGMVSTLADVTTFFKQHQK